MKLGMSRTAARERIEQGCTWEELRTLMLEVHAKMASDPRLAEQRCSLNKGMSLATSWNIMWKAGVRDASGKVELNRETRVRSISRGELYASNILRCFGTGTTSRRKRPLPELHHEPLMVIEQEGGE